LWPDVLSGDEVRVLEPGSGERGAGPPDEALVWGCDASAGGDDHGAAARCAPRLPATRFPGCPRRGGPDAGGLPGAVRTAVDRRVRSHLSRGDGIRARGAG